MENIGIQLHPAKLEVNSDVDGKILDILSLLRYLPVKCQDFKLPNLSANTPTTGVASASITWPEIYEIFFKKENNFNTSQYGFIIFIVKST